MNDKPAEHLKCIRFTLGAAWEYFTFEDGSVWAKNTDDEWECLWQPKEPSGPRADER